MARPIQNTPTIKGEDAKKIQKRSFGISDKRNLRLKKRMLKKKEIKRDGKKTYNLLVSISGGTFY